MVEKDRTELISGLLREERVALASYRAVAGLADDRLGRELRRIEREHEQALSLLENYAAGVWEEPEADPEVWKAWSGAVDASAHHRGAEAALSALKAGEEHGARDYEDAVLQEALSFELRELVGTKLLPLAREHVARLERLLRAR